MLRRRGPQLDGVAQNVAQLLVGGIQALSPPPVAFVVGPRGQVAKQLIEIIVRRGQDDLAPDFARPVDDPLTLGVQHHDLPDACASSSEMPMSFAGPPAQSRWPLRSSGVPGQPLIEPESPHAVHSQLIGAGASARCTRMRPGQRRWPGRR